MGNAALNAEDSQTREFVATVQDSFQAAARSTEPTTRDFLIGGHLVRLLFAGPALLPVITPALAHLAAAADGREPSVTICLWDSASTHTPELTFWGSTDGASQSRTFVYQDSQVSLTADGATLNLLATDVRLAFYWTRDARQVPRYERGAPLLAILRWWVSAHGLHAVHAAAVGTPAGGVLLTGRGGAGKSTTALACLAPRIPEPGVRSPKPGAGYPGLRYVSDDYCLLDSQPSPSAWSLYNTGKLTPDSLRLLPQFSRYVHNPAPHEDDKAIVFLHQHFPEQMATSIPIRAVLLPRVSPTRDTTLRPASAAEGLKAMAPSTILAMTGFLFRSTSTAQTAMRAMAALMRQVPCYHIEVGTELQQIPDVIGRLLDGLPAVLSAVALAEVEASAKAGTDTDAR